MQLLCKMSNRRHSHEMLLYCDSNSQDLRVFLRSDAPHHQLNKHTQPVQIHILSDLVQIRIHGVVGDRVKWVHLY